jgi:hypothetical protein
MCISSPGMVGGNNVNLSQLGCYTDGFMARYIAKESGMLTTAATSGALLSMNLRNSKLESLPFAPTWVIVSVAARYDKLRHKSIYDGSVCNMSLTAVRSCRRLPRVNLTISVLLLKVGVISRSAVWHNRETFLGWEKITYAVRIRGIGGLVRNLKHSCLCFYFDVGYSALEMVLNLLHRAENIEIVRTEFVCGCLPLNI